MQQRGTDARRAAKMRASERAEPLPLLPTPPQTDDSQATDSAQEQQEDDGASSGMAAGVPLLQVLTEGGNGSEGSSSGRSSPGPASKQCRICLEAGGKDLIAPCRCRGTQKYVHRSCLDSWRMARVDNFGFSHCTECRAPFRIRVNVPPDRWWREIRFRLLVVRDHTVVFFLVQSIVALVGSLVYFNFGDDLKHDLGYVQHASAFNRAIVLLLVMVGLLYGSLVAIICGQRITGRYEHILQKQDITKEYIVEDVGDEDMSQAYAEEESARALQTMGLF